MKVLMLGWEYPPQIAGGLGIACEGLTKALAHHSLDLTFVVPKLYGKEKAGHMNLIDSHAASKNPVTSTTETKIEKISIPAHLQPYWTPKDYQKSVEKIKKFKKKKPKLYRKLFADGIKTSDSAGDHYGSDLMAEVQKYAERVLEGFHEQEFDLIHAHDWMTYPAAVALADHTGTPLIVHVHSMEADRSGGGANPDIEKIERMGMEAATGVIAVSHYTKGRVCDVYGIPTEKVFVVHNGIYSKPARRHYYEHLHKDKKIVLFLGRITFQKGPDYFVKAAAKVLHHMDDVIFVMAGKGDMLNGVKQMVREYGIAEHFHFPGFIKGPQIEEYYTLADLYVMPSISEPFGLTALEAVSFRTPAIISKQSGVSEVIKSSLKFDFWDTDLLADHIINALLHDELRAELTRMAKEELKALRWEAAAHKTVEIYHNLLIG